MIFRRNYWNLLCIAFVNIHDVTLSLRIWSEEVRSDLKIARCFYCLVIPEYLTFAKGLGNVLKYDYDSFQARGPFGDLLPGNEKDNYDE